MKYIAALSSIAFLTFIALTLYHVFKRTGKAKLYAAITGILFLILLMVGVFSFTKPVLKTEIVTEIETISYTMLFQNDPSMPEGQVNTTRKGISGKKVVTYRVEYKNSQLVRKKKVKEKIVKEPIDEIVMIGTGKREPYITPPEPEKPYEYNIEAATQRDWTKMTHDQQVNLVIQFMNKYKGGVKQNPEALIAAINERLFPSPDTPIKTVIDTAYNALESQQAYEKKKTGLSQIAIGMSKEQVEQLVGPPEDSQVLRSEYATLEYWYYNFGGKTYQIGFENGVVNAINQY